MRNRAMNRPWNKDETILRPLYAHYTYLDTPKAVFKYFKLLKYQFPAVHGMGALLDTQIKLLVWLNM